ncbi:MAG: nicotinate-nucleotide--dimethylbenzimidazole phosphoribosyltransferase [Deltaproteobacteria bacterium]|nr:nicotinate-nucleotide--dimethylbenzimidazole phosphoribosyltransferase [Deltaproteobacteria bacterium]MBW2121931.1 nicotinate-nucleotide--dimethylbenzimidazole phosphoribosyltransferase [Deltaproteobacteria bacterium]
MEEYLARVEPLKDEFLEEAQKRLDSLTKPRGSLGRLEEFVRHYVAVKQELRPAINRKTILILAGDHGVAEEEVSLYPKEVTSQMVRNFLHKGAAISVLARFIGARLYVVDMGVDHDFEPVEGLVIRRVARGTANITKGPAMTARQALEAVLAGIEIVEEVKREGVDIIGVGDMGIGNTTPSSAIIAAVAGLPAREVTGRGTGVDDRGLEKKIEVVERALSVNRPDPRDPLDVLAKLGGFEIAGITGVAIGASANRIPVVADGLISTAGILIATEMNPRIKAYIFASHSSAEIGHRVMLDRIGIRPVLDLSMRLGEGTGAALGIQLVDAALRLYNEMATFEEAGVSGKKG